MRKMIRKLFVGMRKSFWRVSCPYAITIIGLLVFAFMGIAMSIGLLLGLLLAHIGVPIATVNIITVITMFTLIGLVAWCFIKIDNLMINHYFDN